LFTGVPLQGIFVEKHFEPDAQLSFSLVEEDPVTKQPVSALRVILRKYSL
jgi:hypothetical protein